MYRWVLADLGYICSRTFAKQNGDNLWFCVLVCKEKCLQSHTSAISDSFIPGHAMRLQL